MSKQKSTWHKWASSHFAETQAVIFLTVSCSTGLFPSSPVTSTGPCSQPWLAINLSLCVCCWRMEWIWGISCRTRRLCASSTNRCPAASFSANWPSGSKIQAASGGEWSASGLEITRVNRSPWLTCLARCATCWAVSPSPSTSPLPR